MSEYFVKHSELFTIKTQLWESQGKICPLCAKEIPKIEAVMDHCHESGYLRGVLHDRCNKALAFLESSLKFVDSELFYRNIISYLEQHSTDPSLQVHPRHERLDREKLKRSVKIPRLQLSTSEKLLYKKALEEGPIVHPNPKKKTSREGSWKRTAEKHRINHGRLLAYVTGARSMEELE